MKVWVYVMVDLIISTSVFTLYVEDSSDLEPAVRLALAADHGLKSPTLKILEIARG